MTKISFEVKFQISSSTLEAVVGLHGSDDPSCEYGFRSTVWTSCASSTSSTYRSSVSTDAYMPVMPPGITKQPSLSKALVSSTLQLNDDVFGFVTSWNSGDALHV